MKEVVKFTILSFLLIGMSSFSQPNAQQYFETGITHLNNKEFVKAIGDFTNAISLKEDFSEAYLHRAKAKELLAKQVGFENNELCFDLVQALKYGNSEAIQMLEGHCMMQCYDLRMATFEPSIVFCADFSSKVLYDLPEEAKGMTNLVKLVLFNNKLTALSDKFRNLSSLIRLDVSSNRLKMLSSNVGYLKNLEEVNFNKNSLKSLPNEFTNATKLKYLYLRSNSFEKFPIQVLEFSDLEELDLSLNEISNIPVEITKLKKLKKLNLVGNPLGKKDMKALRAALPNTTIYMDE